MAARATAAEKSKHAYDPNMFDAEPPGKDKLVKELFCGRHNELDTGVHVLRKFMDVKGARGKKHDKRPWVIHGESRSGKSHLARRIMLGLPRGPKRHYVPILSRERIEAAAVMWDIFGQVRVEFETRTADVTLPPELGGEPLIRLTRRLMHNVSRFQSGADNVTLEINQAEKDAISVGLKGGIPKILELSLGHSSEHTTGDSIKVSLCPPTPTELADYCGLMMEALLAHNLLSHLFVLVDDMDLIQAYVDTTLNGRLQRSVLADALTALHRAPGIDVLLTARSWYAHSKKEFKTLIDLTQSPSLTEQDMIDIHDRRFEVLGAKDLPKAFLAEPALRQAAGLVNGLPGVFLRHLDTAFGRYQSEEGWDTRDFDWYLGVFRHIWDEYRGKYPHAANELENAVKEERATINASEKNPFYQTVFHDEFAVQCYYGEHIYSMTPLAHLIIKPESLSE